MLRPGQISGMRVCELQLTDRQLLTTSSYSLRSILSTSSILIHPQQLLSILIHPQQPKLN
jgi:hypothetical protein